MSEILMIIVASLHSTADHILSLSIDCCPATQLTAYCCRHALLHGRSLTIDCCPATQLAADYCRHAPLHGRSRSITHYRLLSSNPTYCRLLSPRATPRPIKKYHSLSIVVDYYLHAHFFSALSVFRRKSVRLSCRSAAICFLYVALDGQRFLL